HEESRRLQGAGGDLGRRLTQATDAVGLLETATSEAARKARPKDGATTSARERKWSPAPPAEPLRESEPPREKSRFDRPPRDPEPKASEPTAASYPASDATEDKNESTGRDLALSGYRMGKPRAQGPDPYARYDDAESDAGSNVRHFPTPDRELGEELKLSGLLGPSGSEREEGEDDKEETD
ncbi:MAG: hypothetical protein AAGC67_12635, partial [Myxococcota bacterium]